MYKRKSDIFIDTHRENKEPSFRDVFMQSRFLWAVVLLFFMIITGTLGFVIIEGWGFFDSLYMTVITISTVGFSETHPLSPTGRIFTTLLIFCSFGVVGYSLSTLAACIMEGELNRIIRGRRMGKKISKLKDHYILCGAGNTGKSIADEFSANGTPFILVERDLGKLNHVQKAIGGLAFIHGDATLDETLEIAGIKRAKGLVTVLTQDKDNVFVALTARGLNPDLRIVSRVIDTINSGKLYKAGADELVSPNLVGGVRMAQVLLKPEVVNFLDAVSKVTGNELRMEEFIVKKSSSFAEQSLAKANIGKKTGLLVVAVKHLKGSYKFNPGANTMIRTGDILIVMGTEDQITALNTL